MRRQWPTSKTPRSHRRDAVFYAVEVVERRLLLSAIHAKSTLISDFTVTNQFFTMSSVTVDLSITFQNDSHLAATLTSPQGTTIQLFDDPAAEQNFSGTVFDQTAPQRIDQVAAPQFAGTFQPVRSLSAFNGQNPNGNWKLAISNSSSATGTLNSFSVSPVDQDPSAGFYVIPSGQTLPLAINGTDLGATASGITREFYLKNTGAGIVAESAAGATAAELDLGPTSVTISGADASAFSATQPDSPLASGDSTFFDVVFTPRSGGLQTAEVLIKSSGSEDAFAIQATGLAQPIINVSAGPVVSVSATFTQTFTVSNSGLAPLQLTSPPAFVPDSYSLFAYLGNDPSDLAVVYPDKLDADPPFSISSEPLTNVIAPGASTTFVIGFNEGVAENDVEIPGSGTLYTDYMASLAVYSNDPALPVAVAQSSVAGLFESPGFRDFGTPLPAADASASQDGSLPFTVSEDGAQLSNDQTIHLGYLIGGAADDSAQIELANNGQDILVLEPTDSGMGFSISGAGGTDTVGSQGTADVSIIPSVDALQSISGSISILVYDETSGMEESFALNVDGQIVPPPIGFTSTSATSFVTGRVASFSFTTSAFPAATFTESGALPAGVSFNSSTGLLSGTPSGKPGTYRLTLDASNNVAPAALQSFSLLLEQAPAIAASGSPVFKTGSSEMFSIAVTGYPVCTVTETGTLPSGMSFNAASAILYGTPAANTGGSYAFTITAANGVSPIAISEFTLTVDQPPSITSASNSGNNFAAGYAGSFAVSATGYPRPTLSQSGKLPSGVSFTANANASATIDGIPAAAGNYKLTLIAASGDARVKQSFTLVANLPKAPVITNVHHATFIDGHTSAFTVTASGSPLATLSRVGALPAGVSFSSTGGKATIAGDPSAAGSFSVTILAQNAVGSALPQLFTLTSDQSPRFTVSATSATFHTGTSSTVNVGTTGFPIAKVTKTGNLPKGMTFTAFANGTAELTGAAAPGTGGTYKLNLTASNGVLPALMETYLLTVDQPVAFVSASQATFKHGKAGTFLVKTTGYPVATLTDQTPTSGLNFVSNSHGIGELTSTTALAEGTYTLVFSTGAGGPTQTFTLIVD